MYTCICPGMEQDSSPPTALAIAGSAFVAYGLLRKDALGIVAAIAGGGIAALALNPGRTRSVANARPILIEKTVTVTSPPVEAYNYWRKLENLPRFLNNLHSIDPSDGDRHTWSVRGRLGLPLRWQTEIRNDQPGRLVEWHSVPGSPIESMGMIRFKQKKGGRGTKIHVRFAYVPASGFSAAQLNALAAD